MLGVVPVLPLKSGDALGRHAESILKPEQKGSDLVARVPRRRVCHAVILPEPNPQAATEPDLVIRCLIVGRSGT